jgi:ribosomal protein S18 acetylase RimI-like enzyme
LSSAYFLLEIWEFATCSDICNLTPSNSLLMALKIIDYGTKEYEEMVTLRNEVLRKPLGMEFTPEELERERNNLLMGAYEDEQMLGCCMLVEEEPGTVRLRQMAVINDLQGKGIGKALMQFAENLARDRGYRKITMHARKNALGFYEKMGYRQVGEEFEEITIPHYVMEKEL